MHVYVCVCVCVCVDQTKRGAGAGLHCTDEFSSNDASAYGQDVQDYDLPVLLSRAPVSYADKREKRKKRGFAMDDDSAAAAAGGAGVGREDSPGGPTPGPKYSYMGHVLSLLCTVINDRPPGQTDDFLTN